METSGVSAEMALELSEALGTSPELWLNLQIQYDLWQASKAKRKKISRSGRRLTEFRGPSPNLSETGC